MSNDKAETGIIVMLPIMIIISLVVVMSLGSSVVPQSITAASDTGNITGYGTNWTAQSKNNYATATTFFGLVYMFVPIIILLGALGIIMKAL